ncbi:hypothetical protein PoB_004308400 [Plakobranchus ocellatus]|uniref:Uncharacterized protein n=1 Tax=Plakobranchus ocellatus TaxID=259542 RepID=A0AAV4B8Z3_9GAST|nr:hypothetical protein PoB_004308400 [Plakobranchus ocellatus]
MNCIPSLASPSRKSKILSKGYAYDDEDDDYDNDEASLTERYTQCGTTNSRFQAATRFIRVVIRKGQKVEMKGEVGRGIQHITPFLGNKALGVPWDVLALDLSRNRKHEMRNAEPRLQKYASIFFIRKSNKAVFCLLRRSFIIDFLPICITVPDMCGTCDFDSEAYILIPHDDTHKSTVGGTSSISPKMPTTVSLLSKIPPPTFNKHIEKCPALPSMVLVQSTSPQGTPSAPPLFHKRT